VANRRNVRIVYIVDDDDSVRKSLSRLMRAHGIEAKSFATTESFRAAVVAEPDACVLLDITMPKMTGLQVGALLKQPGIAIPIIAISARDDDQTRAAARSLGVRFFLSKPVDGQALLDAIVWVTEDEAARRDGAT
jgi:FixJ family two-component response regulator